MSNVRACLRFDETHDGEQALSEFLAEMQAQGHATNAAEPIRNAQGKLIAVDVNLPDAASDAAKAALASLPGQGKAVVLPQQLVIIDVTNIVLATSILPGPPTAGTSWGDVAVRFGPPTSTGTAGGVLTGDGVTNSYQDVVTNPDPSFQNFSYLTMQAIGNGGTVPQTATAPVGDLTIHFDSQSLLIGNLSPLSVTVNTGNLGTLKEWYIAADGSVYLRRYLQDSATIIPARSYAEAVKAGKQ